jgi:hypothetical protein
MPTPDRRFSSRFFGRTLVILSFLILTSIVAACASAGAAPGAPAAGGKDLGFAPVPGEAVGGGTGTGTGEQLASIADRKIVRTGEISVEVSNVAAAVGRVRALALELGGYVGSSESGSQGQSATLTLRIPADRFEDALAGIHKLDGDVLNEATREEDVTTAVVDLEARLKNLQASEVQYRALLTQAVKIEDILSVQTRLDDVRGQIEQLQAQDKELTGLADLATLTVTLVPGAVQQATGNWDPGKTVTDAYAALVGFGQNIANGVIWFAIVVLPALIGLAILFWLWRRLAPGIRIPMRRASKE